MKKLFMFLAVAGLATFGIACSSSDDSDEPIDGITLVVTASNATAEIGETVTFTVNEGTTDVTVDADIYINGTIAPDKKLTSKTEGEFKVVAKKANAIDSEEIIVKFGPKAVKKLVLTATPTTIDIDTETVFKVILNNTDVTARATIKVEGIIVTGGKYRGTAVGSYIARASLAGSEDSNEVTIIVKEADVVPPTENFLKVGNAVKDLKLTNVFQFFKFGGVNFQTVTRDGALYVPFGFRTFISDTGQSTIEDYKNFIGFTVYVKQAVAVGREVTNANVVRPWQVDGNVAGNWIIGDVYGAMNAVDFDASEEIDLSFSFTNPPAPRMTTGEWKFNIVGGLTLNTALSIDAAFDGVFVGYYNINASTATAVLSIDSKKALKNNAKMYRVRTK